METLLSKVENWAHIARSKGFTVCYDTQTGLPLDQQIQSLVSNSAVSQLSIPEGNWKQAIETKEEEVMVRSAVYLCGSHAIDILTLELENNVFQEEDTHHIVFIEETNKEGESWMLICSYVDDVLILHRKRRRFRTWDVSHCAWYAQA